MKNIFFIRYTLAFLLSFTLFAISFTQVVLSDDKITKVNRLIIKKHYWNFKLQEVNRNQDIISIHIKYSNRGSYRMPIFLGQGKKSITKVDDDGVMISAPLPDENIAKATLSDVNEEIVLFPTNVTGIESEEFVDIEPGKSGTAIFNFETIPGLKLAKFESTWITVIMRGTSGVIPVNALIEIPD